MEKESTEVRITKNIGKEKGNNYRKRKTLVIVKMYQLSFCVFMCAFPLEISSESKCM
jgi:hypothetical protein